MSLMDYVTKLEAKGIELWVEGERLRYRAPKEQMTPALLAELKQFKNELLPILKARAGAARLQPVSHGQQALWMLYQLAPRSAAYNILYAARLHAAVDLESLQRALELLVARHAILRTTYSLSDGVLAQQVHPHRDVALRRLDVTGLGAEAVNRLMEEEADRPFDLGEEPVLRLTLLAQQPQAGQGQGTGPTLLLTVHHIAADFWSLELLVNELSALYGAVRAGSPSPLPALELQFTDHVRWEDGRSSGAEGTRLLNYWREQLRGAPTVLNLPADRPRPSVQQFRGTRYSVALDSGLTQRLRMLAKSAGATPYVLLMTAFQVLLSRYSGQEDLLIGTPTAGRNQPGSEGVVGNFINPVVIRGDLSGNPTFRALLGKVRQTVLRALEHADYPVSLLVKQLDVARDASRSALYQVMYVWHQQHQSGAAAAASSGSGALVAEVLGATMQRGAAQDLLLAVLDTGDQLVCNWTYNVDLFDAGTIARMGGHFAQLLESIVADADARVSSLQLLSNDERNQILREWNATEVEYEEQGWIHELIEARAESNPGQPAVLFEGRVVSYGELNQRANQLAHHLRKLGVGANVRVGVCLERSVEMVVGLLGVMKAGGAYVPLDPTYPRERLAYMVEDARVPVLLTQQRCLELLPAQTAHVLCLDTGWQQVAGERTDNPRSGVEGKDLAYVIYTSGSTGRPKGAMNTHEAIKNRLLWMQAAYGLGPKDRVLQKTPFSFDVSVWEFFWPLMMGAGLVVARPEGHRDTRYLARLMEEYGVSTLHFVPSMLQAFLEEPEAAELKSVRQVFCSGEGLPKLLRDRFLARYPGKALHNLYGPTEAAVDVSFWPCQEESGYEGVPIGRPIANTQLYVLDRHLQPVPVGVAGALYIGGVGLARGYLGRADLTAERFIPDPFSRTPGARMYQTGDVARYLPGGVLDFLGRSDHQVKIRGFRIELQEIEAVLAQHPAVRDCVVLNRRTAQGDSQLVAYVVPDRQSAQPILQRLRLEREGVVKRERLHELPNGMAIAQLNRGETEFLYKEIFEQQAYLKHGVSLRDGDCVFDVGANIGLASLYFGLSRKNVSIYAYEPVPEVFELLRINSQLHGLDVKALKLGLSDTEKNTTFTYYPNNSIISGQSSDSTSEREVVKTFLARQQRAELGGAELPVESVDELLRERLKSQQISVQLSSISAEMRKHGVERIDLLKVDVEKSELEVLAGIQESDWPRIRQIVIEVHDADGALEKTKRLLEGHGYTLTIEQDPMLEGTALFNVYAVRVEHGSLQASAMSPRDTLETPRWSSPERLVEALRGTLQEKLPEYMVPFSITVLEALPLSPNGKLDRQALLALEAGPSPQRPDRVQPRNEVESRLVQLWHDVLGSGPIGVLDDFFELGGHSLLAMRLVSRVNQAFQQKLPVGVLFEARTIEALARRLASSAAGEREAQGSGIIELRKGKPGQVPLFLVHPVGGSVFCYRELVQSLSTEHPVHGIQAPQAVSGASSFTTIEDMAEAYLKQLLRLQPVGPFMLGGWSMGGVVAFEMARQLRQRGEQVSLLALVEAHLPDAEGTDSVLDDPALPLLTLALDQGLSWARLEGLRQALSQRRVNGGETLDSAEAVEAFLALMRAEGVALDGVTSADVQDSLAVIARNLGAFRSYRPGPYEGSCSVFRAGESPLGMVRRPDLGWGRWSRSVEVHDLEGDHFSILLQPQVRRLAQRLDAQLVKVAATLPGRAAHVTVLSGASEVTSPGKGP